jgi:hypothetical protein
MEQYQLTPDEMNDLSAGRPVIVQYNGLGELGLVQVCQVQLVPPVFETPYAVDEG